MFKGTPSDVSLHIASAVPALKKRAKSSSYEIVILSGNESASQSVVRWRQAAGLLCQVADL
jgi:hypothetical protein